MHERLGVAAQVQPEAGPVADAVERHGDLVPLRLRAGQHAAVEVVVHPVPHRVGLPAIRQSLRRAAHHVVHGVRGDPVGHEHAEDAAVEQRVAIDVGEALPRHDRLQRRRLQIGDEPLVDREIRDAGQPDVAVAPRLRRRPFDRVVEVDRLGERPGLALARRLAAAAPVDAHRGVALRHPPLRRHGLPVHAGRGLLLEIGRRHPELVLLVRPEIEDGRKLAAVVGTEHVGLEPRAVAHRHVDVFLDQEFVGGGGGFDFDVHTVLIAHSALILRSARSARLEGWGGPMVLDAAARLLTMRPR